MLITEPRDLVAVKHLLSQCCVTKVFHHLWLVNKELISQQLAGREYGRTSDPSEKGSVETREEFAMRSQ